MLFFLGGIAEQAKDATMRAKQLQDLQEEWHKRLTQTRTSALALRLADVLFTAPILTIPQAQRLLNVTYLSAQRNIERLVQAGILHLARETSYGKTYIASEILDLLRQS